jgi:hypothetical protein
MEFFTTDVEGVTLMNPGSHERLAVLQSVHEDPDADYPEAFLSGAGGIVLGYRAGGILSWEEEGEVRRFVKDITMEAAASAWTSLADGDTAALEQLDWTLAG